ncbi:hypothetical protein LAZ67_2005924 [Cordylochernes scorpioides]|uniref:CCHC-type domain-containing protein n=1 Tax=Cordylochernes scorpioides TaxID=51811 RepID=A0ABY6K514_9ARAC|nr:hypothetical protein LAZ67_2005924 [Cordylochernes scorpioides]
MRLLGDVGKVQRQNGSGRPRATIEREDRAIVRMVVAAPESTLSTIQRVTGTQVSKMTINRRLRERNLRALRPLRCLPLKPVHRQVRLQWCRERLTWNCADWGRIVFSDESRFLLCPNDRRKRVWRRPGQREDPGLTVEHHTGPQQGVMVWGAISFDSRSPLVVIPGTLTAQRYVYDILRPVLLPFLSHHPGLTFQQDNARPHTPGREEKAVPIFGTLLDQKMEREEALERLKKKRTILRTSLSKYGKRIEEYDVHKECDHEELLGQLSDVYEELRRVDEEIGKLIDIKDLEKDLKMVEEYREKAVAWKYLLKKISLVVAEGMQRETATATKKEYPGEIGRPTLTGMVKLPKLTMERFYGEISQWLNFWNAFDSSINRNEHLTKIDKFNYLKAYLGGTAAQTVEGFCLSEENYDKAVELLKKRFGKGERLIDVHMNNLLALKPLRVTKDVRAFRELYGRILVQIRSLESLGVVVESYGYLLCPLLLKLLPSDLKLELHREFTGAFSLGDLIEFLERQLIALESTFGTRDEITAGQPSNEHPQSQSSIVKYRRNQRNPLPTAAGFLNASEAVNKRKNCAFCERDHESTKCEFAENLTLEDKLGKLKKKGACFRCLKYGHLSKFCKVKTSCTSCGELRHSRIMCPRKNQNATPARGMMRDETLTNLTTPVVLLPTLRVTIRGKCKERMGRILIDTGSQRSYVLQDTAEEMGYECSKKESLRHSLFGGSNTELYEHGVYDIRLSNLDGSYGCNFEALSQDVICDSVPRVHQGKWMQDLSAHDIELTDLHRGPLEILIGADIAGKLLTGEHRRLPSGLVAVQTRLGWTLMGKIPATEEETSVSGLCTTSLLTSDLENLWRLEAIGISDARQDDSIQKETEEYFARTISQEVTCQLVQARSRVAPLKGTTIPRLELLACLVGARLVNNVVRDLKFEDMERFYWTDSMNALHWIKGKDNWATFVMNRVMEIRSLSETEDWYRVPGCLNPADLPSRGCLADSLERSKWWEGPSWLRRPRRDWPHREIYPDPDIVNSEKRKIVLTSTCIEREKDQYYYRFSNYYKILRVTAWMNRFLTNARGTIGQRVKGDLTVNEIKRAELMLVRVIQRESFTGPEDKRLKDFKKILGQARLEFEELYTIICDTESLMNSRPLTYMSEDVEDLSPLTPALFFHDLKEIGVPDLDSIERASLQKRYRFRQRLREDLRKRFRTEYFGFLRQDTRRRSKTRPIKVGDLVLIGQDNAKRVNWPLARVVEVYPGRDGPVRVAKLRTSKGVQIRPVQRLYNLEIPADLGSTLRSIQSEPRRGGSRGEASKDPTKIAQS